MGLVVRQVTLQAPATNTTQNYTVSSFGTPEAAIVLFSNNSSGSWVTDGVLGMGFWDGSNNKVAMVGIDDGDTTGANNSQWGVDGSNVVWTLYDGSSPNMRKASVTGTVTDGLTLTWTGSDTVKRPYVTVILLKGLNGVKAGFRAPTQGIDETTITSTTGITPKLVLFAGGRSSVEDTNASEASIFMGFACDNGSTIDQGCVSWRMNDTNPTDWEGQINNGYCVTSDIGNNGVLNGANECTAMAADSFTTVMRLTDPIVSGHVYLALDFNESVVGFDAATPSASGDWDPFTASFMPQWAFMFPTAYDTMNQAEGGAQDGVESFGLYSVIDADADGDTDDEDGHYATSENGATTNHFAESRHDTRFEINQVTGTPTSANLVNGNSPTFDATGIVYADANFTHDTTARQVVGFFVERTQVLGPMMSKMMHEGHLNG